VEVVFSGFVAALIAALVALAKMLYDGRQQRSVLLQQVKESNQREAEFGRQLDQQKLEWESQTRAALRGPYANLLIAQRRSREASLQLAREGQPSEHDRLLEQAIEAHDEFIDTYHQLNLDSDREMWLEVRSLREVLGEMLKEARNGNAAACDDLAKIARHARQNLERAFRRKLGYEPHQARRPLGKYDKVERSGIAKVPDDLDEDD